MKKFLFIVIAIVLFSTISFVVGFTMAPDFTYVGCDRFTMAPDSTYVGCDD